MLDNIEDELIGGILSDSTFYYKVRDRVFKEMFTSPINRKMYDVFEEVLNKGEEIDSITVLLQSEKMFKGDSEEIKLHMTKCENGRRFDVSYDSIITELAERYISQELVRINSKFSQWIIDGKYTAEEAMSRQRKAQDKVLSLSTTNETYTIGELVKEYIEESIKPKEDETSKKQLKSGLKFWDSKIGSLNGGKLIVGAARPGMGKTALAVKVAMCYSGQGVPTAVLSYEMKVQELAERFVSPLARVNTRHLSQGTMTVPEKNRLQNLLTDKPFIKDLPLYLEDDNTPHIDTVVTRIILLANMGVKIFFVDQTSKIKGVGKDKAERVGDITNKLKGVAQMMDVDVILLNQINREAEKRGGGAVPVLSDLKESGSLEEDADIVYFIYRPEYYNIMEDSEGNSTENLAKLIVPKNRAIGVGEIKMKFVKWYVDFRDLEEDNDMSFESGDDDDPF